MVNEQAFLQNNPSYTNLYNQILNEEDPIYPDLEVKESDDPIEQNKINQDSRRSACLLNIQKWLCKTH